MIARLKYTDKEQATLHLIECGVINENLTYADITHAVVWLGKLVDKQGEYNEEGEELTPPTYLDGYHVDVMTKEVVDFGEYIVEPNNPRHTFL